ncbi:sensor histidine kinase [Novosphingobium sp. 9]|uniref:sensor histidine kinase n=1 Tax=Novosphingobium sp. 9 TaxID=2025349 RepID=UPI0021B6D097|nr:HWE histidine kinase domain-containing protein [Novosphingobium sp. 9]
MEESVDLSTDGHPSAPMADLIDRYDWDSSPIGPQSQWPQSLRITVDLMLASGHAMCLLWGPDLTLLYNDGYAPFLGARHPQALGMSFRDVWAEIWDDIGPLVERGYAGETSNLIDMPLLMTRNGFPEETWWTFSYSPVRDEHGEVMGLLDVASDSTPRILAERQRDAAEAKLHDSEHFMRNVLAASTDCIKVVELDGSLSFMSEGGMAVMEVDHFAELEGCPWPGMLKGDGTGHANAAIDAAKRGQSSHFEAAADTFRGTPKYWSISVSPIIGKDGQVERILSVSRDHTSLEAARTQQRLLNDELNHRLKNILAMVQSIASQTLRDAESLKDAAAAFSSRLVSLGHAADILTATSLHAADLHDVIRAGLAAVDGKRDRISIEGPSVTLDASAALATTLALHELATNAIKYGALSNDAGTVTLDWTVVGTGDERQFSLRWKEQGGPAVSPPTKRGFGSRLIERSLQSYFRGEARLSYPTDGLEFSLVAPLDGDNGIIKAQ